MPLEGSQLGRYHLIWLLGRGAMGEVYFAEDMGINQTEIINRNGLSMRKRRQTYDSSLTLSGTIKKRSRILPVFSQARID